MTILLLWPWFAGLPRGRFLLLGLVANVLSVPALWLVVLWSLGRSNPWAALFAAEIAVVLFEGLLYARFGPLSRGRALSLSAVANATSFLVRYGLPLALFSLLK